MRGFLQKLISIKGWRSHSLSNEDSYKKRGFTIHKMSKIAVVAVDGKAARLFSRYNGDISLTDEIFPETTGEAAPHATVAHTHRRPAVRPGGAQADRQSFAHAIALWLEEKTDPSQFGRPAAPRPDRLVLFGTPEILNALRETIRNPLYARVIAEIHQDLATLSPEELRGELEKILWF